MTRKTLSTLSITLALAAGISLAPRDASAADAVDTLVVRFKADSRARAVEVPPAIGIRRAIRALRAGEKVAYAVSDHVATASAAKLPNDPGTAPGRIGKAGGWAAKQWNFLPCGSLCGQPSHAGIPESTGGIGAPGAWSNLKLAGRPGGEGVTVAVLDTGIAYRTVAGAAVRNPDLFPRRFVGGYDFVDRDSRPLDPNGHGTHLAGTIGEQTGNRLGLTGLAYRAKLMPVRVLNQAGNGRSLPIARGIRFAARHGADVINMSFNFGCKANVPVVAEALRYASRRGVVLVASAGNRGCVASPAGEPKVISVGGTTEGACLGSYSPSSEEVDLVAPGGGIPDAPCTRPSTRPVLQVTLSPDSPLRFGVPRFYVGTSMSAAHVSGVAALTLASGVLGRNDSPEQVRLRLQATARDLGLPAAEQGAGLIDAEAATERP